jgi:hypothetical protein
MSPRKLGCLRPSLDMLCAFPQHSEEFTELRGTSPFYMDRAENESSTTSVQPVLQKDYRQILWAQKAEQQHDICLPCYQNGSQKVYPGFGSQPIYQNYYKASVFTMVQTLRLIASSVHSEFLSLSQVGSPVTTFQTHPPGLMLEKNF